MRRKVFLPSIAPLQIYLPRTARLIRGLAVVLIQILVLHLASGLAASIHGRVEGPRGLLAGAEVRLLQQQRQVLLKQHGLQDFRRHRRGGIVIKVELHRAFHTAAMLFLNMPSILSAVLV